MKRPIESVVFLMALSGLALVANGLWIPAKAELAQFLIEKAWVRVLAGDLRARPWPWADTWPVARLVVPGIGVDLYVLAGVSGQSLAFGPSHVSASAKPGAPDNIVLAGHRDTHFSFLRDLEAGDELILESPGRSHRYHVDGMEIVHESRTDLLLPSGHSELTLITCFPFDSVVPGGPLRYVIFASRSR
jgi:sortase A